MQRRQMIVLPAAAVPMMMRAAEGGSSNEKAVLAAVQKWRTATLAQDRKALESLIDPDAFYSHSSGRFETGKQQIDATVAGTPKYEVIDISDTQYREVGATACVRCNMKIRTVNAGTVNNLKLNALMVWVKQGGNWKMVARQSTRLPD